MFIDFCNSCHQFIQAKRGGDHISQAVFASSRQVVTGVTVPVFILDQLAGDNTVVGQLRL